MGELHDLGLSDIFQILALSRRTGALVVTTPTHMAHVAFLKGDVVAAGLSAGAQPVGAWLCAAGLITATQLHHLEQHQQRGLRGLALWAAAHVAPKPVLGALEAYTKQLVTQLLAARVGTFAFSAAVSLDPWQHFDVTAASAVCPRGLQAQYLAMEALRLNDEGAAHAPAPSSPVPLERRGSAEEDWSALIPELDASLASVPLPTPGTAAPQAPLASLRNAVVALDTAATDHQMAQALLDGLALHCERGAYFRVGARGLIKIRGFGGACGDRLVKNQVPVAPAGAVARVVKNQQTHLAPLPRTAAYAPLVDALGGPWHHGAMLIAPVVQGGEVLGLLVGDNPSGRPLRDAPGVDILLAHARAHAAPSRALGRA